MLNTTYQRGDPIFSDENQQRTYMDECRIRGLITCADDIKYVIKTAFVPNIDMECIRDWITYFHNQD